MIVSGSVTPDNANALQQASGFQACCRACLAEVKNPAASYEALNLQRCGVFDPRGSRQMDMQACPLGSLLAGIKKLPGKTLGSKSSEGGTRTLDTTGMNRVL